MLKLIYHNLIIFIVLYFFLSALYRLVLINTKKEREVFKLLCIFVIVIGFVLVVVIVIVIVIVVVVVVIVIVIVIQIFELLCIYAARFQSYIPLNFLIGFYVQQVQIFSFALVLSLV